MTSEGLFMLLLATLALLGLSGAAALDKRDVPITPDLKTMYPIPLQIFLRQDKSIATFFEAEVYNHNSKKVKVLKFGTFLHDDDVALKVADIFYQDTPVRFLGITPLLNFGNVDNSDFVEIESGGSIKVKFDVAEHFDLSVGESFTIEMKGSLPVTGFKAPNFAGYIPYNSNQVEFKVDRRAAELTRMNYLERMPKVLHQNCKGGKWDRENKIREALSECVHLAGQGKKAARIGPAWRMEEAFGSSNEATREHVISVFSEAERKCMHDLHKVDQICAEYYGECLSNRKIVTSYIHEPTLQVGYCDEFFWLSNIPKKCHSYDSPKAWGWHSSRSSTVIRQMIHSNLRRGANASTHTEHGLARILALDVDQSLNNADNYELFVTHYNLDCKAVSPPRSALSHHERSIDQSSLSWGPCSQELLGLVPFRPGTKVDCATLEVPLDHTKKTSRDTIALQLVRLNATKSPAKAKSILFNPGGPGASGIEHTPTTGQAIHDALGGKFNIIGFDPRGTGRTIPFSCQPNNNLARREDELDELAWPMVDTWPSFKEEGWAYVGHIADQCFNLQQKYGRYIGTVATARDMLAIVNALGEDGQLRYWGISYGTMLGQVFASMFPGRVNRMVLDGNVMTDDYVSDAGIRSFRNSNKAFDHFLDQCYQEPEFCELSHAYKTPARLREAINDAFKKMLGVESLDPNEVLDPRNLNPSGLEIFRKAKADILKRLYSVDGFIFVLHTIERYILPWKTKRELPELQEQEGLRGSSPRWNQGLDAHVGIHCSDSSDLRVDIPEDLYAIIRAHTAQSSFGDIGGAPELKCARWKFDAIEQVNTTLLRKVTTSFPILITNGKYDPITPLDSAWEVSHRLRGSRVLVHDGVGHSVMQNPSKCTYQFIRDYFTDGTMPELGTVCKADTPPFKLAHERAVMHYMNKEN